MDAYGLSRNPDPLDEDLIGATWNGDCDRGAVFGGQRLFTSLCFLALMLRFRYKA